jgi:hypothetical protein
MWEHDGCFENLQQDAISKFGDFDCCDIEKCEVWQRAVGTRTCQMQQEGVQPNSVTFVGLLNAWASVIALEEGRCVHEQITESSCKSDLFVGIACLTCMQNVGAWRMHGECSTRCPLEMWSPGHGKEGLKTFWTDVLRCRAK